jgi:hypothetical protein
MGSRRAIKSDFYEKSQSQISFSAQAFADGVANHRCGRFGRSGGGKDR